MKPVLVFSALFLGISLFSCQDTKEAKPTAQQNIGFFKNIGTQISLETADRWISAYQSTNAEGREGLNDYTISHDQLNSLLQSVTSFVGVALHHGIDENGDHHF